MNRNLDGIYFIVQRDGEYQSICFTDLTEQEIKELGIMYAYDKDAWMRLAMHLRSVIRRLGEELDIVSD